MDNGGQAFPSEGGTDSGLWADLADIPPQEGFYACRRPAAYAGEHWRDRPMQAIRIWFGPPSDPDTGLPLDRSWRWQALLDGEPVPVSEVWPRCNHRSPLQGPITEAEYEEMLDDH